MLAPAPARGAAVERAWKHLVTSGPTLFASERLAVIADARAAWQGSEAPNPASGVVGEATHWLAIDAEGITLELVADFERRGLDRLRYLEVVSIVGLLSNIDWYMRGIGAPLPELPAADDTSPTGRVDHRARMTDSWVPMLTVPGPKISNQSGMTCYAHPMRPESTGSIHITSADPNAPPAIDFNFLTAPPDAELTIRAVRIARSIMTAASSRPRAFPRK